MTKLYLDRIQVQCDGQQPVSFIWRGKVHRITVVLNRWVVRVDWWRSELARRYFKVQCEDLSLYEIYQSQDGWTLERVYD